MRLGWFPGAAIALTASLSVVAFAQTAPQQGGLNIPSDVQFVGPQDTGVRKATAIVNGEVITETDIDHRLALTLEANQVTLPAEEVQRVRAQILRNLIDETLQIQAATQQEIKVEDADVNRAYARVAQGFSQTPEQLNEYLRTIGASERSLKRQIRGQLAWDRLKQRQIDPFVTVGEDEVQRVIDRLNESRGTAEYKVSEIFLSATPETAPQALANAERIVQQIRGGAPFSAYARQFSEASTAATGGDLGWVRSAQLPDELAGLVTQMPVGSVSNPVPVPGGFSVVMLADARQILVADPRDAVLSLMQLSLAIPSGTAREQVEARAQQLGQATQSMGGCGRAPEVAASMNAELISNDQIRVRELPPALQQMLLSLNVGQATTPFGTTERISVLVLCGRDDPEQAQGPSFDQVYAQLNDERVNRRAQRFLRDLRRDAVIDYR